MGSSLKAEENSSASQVKRRFILEVELKPAYSPRSMLGQLLAVLTASGETVGPLALDHRASGLVRPP